MTDPDQKPVISDAESERFFRHWQRTVQPGTGLEPVKEALSAFLMARVPDERRWGAIEADEAGGDYEAAGEWDNGFNACRDAVLQGRSVGDK